MTTQNLNSIITISEYVSPLSAPRTTFNELLVIGKAGVIDTTERLRQYTSAADMLTDGFISTDKEYLAAVNYFSQNPTPTTLWVGTQSVSPAETCAQALLACREASTEWYVGICLEANSVDHLACATYVESAVPTSIYAYTTSDADCITSAGTDIGTTLKGLNYKRSIGQYSTYSSYLPMVAIMGYAMGANNGLANSAYTLMFKGEVGITVENLTSTQVGYLSGKNLNCYLNYGNYYNIFQKGVMANGYFFDEIINLDMLRNDIQLNVMDQLYQTTKVPQTDAGQTQLLMACDNACELAVSRGFLSPGEWTGVTVLNLKYGDVLPKGYLSQSQSYTEQTTADRDARKAMPIYIAIKEAGAVHSIVIGVYVNR
jgi:hypothetical protein